MSPNPKRKHSKSRTRKKRAQKAFSATKLASCPQCGAAHLPHRVCPACGYYGGEPVVSPEGAA